MKKIGLSVLLVIIAMFFFVFLATLLSGCPPMGKKVRQTQQQKEKSEECHDFVVPVPTTFMGEECPRTDQYAEVSGGFVLCHCAGDWPCQPDGGL